MTYPISPDIFTDLRCFEQSCDHGCLHDQVIDVRTENPINSVQTRCIVKARLRKVHFSGDFLGDFEVIFSGSPVL